MFDKRFLITTLLTLSLGAGLAACGDDKDDDKKGDDVTCTDNELKCDADGKTLLVCSNNSFSKKEECSKGCDADKKACKTDGTSETCTDNEYKCDADGKTLLVCSNNSFSKKEECKSGCDADKNACKIDTTNCGNGVIDEADGEICDIGVDKNKNTDDDVVANDATCEMYGETSSSDKGKTWVEGKKPGCAIDCRSLAKGSCKTTQEAEAEQGEGINGIASCGSNLAIDESNKKATAKVTYQVGTTTIDSGVKAAIVCSGATAKVDASVADNVAEYASASGGTVDLEKDLSSLVAGDYKCFIAVKAGDNGAVVCPITSGLPAKASGDVTAFDGSTVSYSVAASTEIKAIFSDFSGSTMKNDIMSEAGMSPTSGSLTTASLKFVALDGTDFNVNKGQNASGQIQALLIGGKGGNADKQWAKEKALTPDTNSHLIVGGINGVSSISIKATSGDGYMYVIADDSASTELVADFQAAKNDWKEVSATIPSGATKLYIYAYGMNTTNLVIDNITLK